jgi:hypothetical protein
VTLLGSDYFFLFKFLYLISYLGEIGKLENYQNDVALVGLTTKLDRRATLKQTE